MRSFWGWLRTVAAIALLAAVLAACGTAPEREADASPTPSQTPELLSRSDVCEKFLEITADLTLDDDESALEFLDLAGRTRNPELAAAIRRVAGGFARHDEEISSAEVQALC